MPFVCNYPFLFSAVAAHKNNKIVLLCFQFDFVLAYVLGTHSPRERDKTKRKYCAVAEPVMAWSTFWIVTQMIMVQKWQKNVTFCIKGALSYKQNYGEEDFLGYSQAFLVRFKLWKSSTMRTKDFNFASNLCQHLITFKLFAQVVSN